MHGPTRYRSGVGIVLINQRGLVFAGHRKDGRAEPWQMPQGGLEPGEQPWEAAFRELAEEIGTTKVTILDSAPSWLRYDYPSSTSTTRAQMFLGQQHLWFLMRFTGRDRDINVGTAHPEFTHWRWMCPGELVESVVPFKRVVYREVMDRFAPVIDQWVAQAPTIAAPAPQPRTSAFQSRPACSG